jgi:hypothetical protein
VAENNRKVTRMAGIVRLGGIAAFAAVVTLGLALGLRAAAVPSSALELMLPLLFAGALVLAFWTTKTLFNAHNYRRADVAILGFVAVLVALGLVALSERAGWFNSRGVIDIRLVALFPVAIVFAIQAKGFARSGGGIWTAIAILYLIASIAMGLALATQVAIFSLTETIEPAAILIMMVLGVDYLIFFLISIAALITHGIGLVAGAGKMQAAA